ncbi:hypothetical protein H8E88_09820 [candidate division KSB1 bacterium]|nr:hypothetical protein [candidate division KSB1 bacterium]MBL7094167.1 hypothetical protein [candidate division KSB1 bacterium]
MFLIVSLWIGDIWGLIALLLFAFNSFSNEHALFGDSHSSVIFFLIFGLFFLSIWLKKKSLWAILLTGFCFGTIPTLRYAEFLLLLVFALFIILHFQKSKTNYISLVVAGIGVGLPTVALAIRNQIAFGAFWKTGYGITDEPAHFGLSYFFQHFMPYIAQLLFHGVGILFIAGLIGAAILIRNKEFRLIGSFLLFLILPLTFLYMAYVWPPDPQSMRFLLPTFPIYIILSVWFLKIVSEKKAALGIISTIFIVFLTALAGLPRSFLSLKHLQSKHAVLANITHVIEENIQPGNILVANEGIIQNLDLLGKWKLSDINLLLPTSDKMLPIIPNNEMLRKRFRNAKALKKYSKLAEDKQSHAVSEDLWKWSERGRIYLLGKDEQVDSMKEKIMQTDSLVIVKRIDIPDIGKLQFSGRNKRPYQRSKFRMSRRKNITRRMKPNQIYDFFVDGKPLFLVEWKRN